ncbi:MAG TPA: aconitase X catalytic domain-containing protein [Methanocorpusculum sp.]|nr:aconitase X catalytic domain-containing protein [Methanocorpusculum sp.]HJK01968.1 aconitase X catalytic domain-containing protein [Methanocorpusculum sp.]
MELDKYDQALLDGEYGESRQKMMEILLALGKIYDAERFIPIKSVQVSGASFKTIGESGLEWLSNIDTKVVVPTFLNPIGMPRNGWERLDIPLDFAKKQLQVNEAYVRIGIRPTCTCTPYYFSIVERGDHLAWSESSAVSYVNSVLGARTNREGGPSAIAAALTGKTPEYGLHIVKNRLPQIEFRLDKPDTTKKWTNAEYGALGMIAGATAGNRIPLFMDLRPNRDMLKSLGAAMAASGAVALYHVNGITPETRFPFFKKHILEDEREVVTIAVSDVQDVFKETEVSAVAIGCPHLSREEVAQVAELLYRKKTVIPFYVFIAEELTNSCSKELAVITKSGAKVVPDTCMVVSPLLDHKGAVMTSSGKAYSYLPSMCGVTPRLGTLEECVRVGCGE